MKTLFYLGALVIMIGCIPKQNIGYTTESLYPIFEMTIPINVEVKELVDMRNDISISLEILDSSKTNSGKNGAIVCVNDDRYYKKDKVTAQISQQIVDHFNAEKLFDISTYNKDEEANYYLTGNLTQFYGEQQMPKAVTSQFGLVGVLGAPVEQTPAIIVIEVSDLRLFKKTGELVCNLGDYRKVYQENLDGNGYNWSIYRNMNDKLKEFNFGLTDKIRMDLANISFE